MRDEVEKISMQRHSNTAFKASLCITEDREAKSAYVMVRNGKLKWQINSLVLFLDKNNTPYITSKFFFDTCYMEQAGVPGPLQPEAVTLDSNNLSFKRNIQRKLEEYIQNWVVFDIRDESKSDVSIIESATEDENKPIHDIITLEEIKPTLKDNTIGKVDLLIYDKFDYIK
ncbi:unnamed protein product [Mytilus coruscus]|uniref:Uncharacterized protein n=1 Tax=Mytilus coruscus TaxID=42192 RepID=A0A6J8E703_MYTCO|nr:unnamed protein product [Mytilus coruscus]